MIVSGRLVFPALEVVLLQNWTLLDSVIQSRNYWLGRVTLLILRRNIMKRQFADRVAVEREILSTINKHFSMCALNGLSTAAISQWSLSEDVPRDVAELVMNISKRVQFDVDASRDVFDIEISELRNTTSDYIEQLKVKLGRLFPLIV